MILKPISLFDCIIFLILLTPRLIYHIGIFTTTAWVIVNIPYLAFQIPIQLLYEYICVRKQHRPSFSQTATVFQNIVIKYVRYGFANLPPKIGRIFFSKQVTLPFTRYRMIKQGYWNSPIHWEEISRPYLNGLWIIPDPDKPPDIVILYFHGGGFSMGSSYFYLEFFLAWITLLRPAFRNPAILSVEYSLVPDAIFPTQLQQALAAYKYALSLDQPICLSGDSAGGTLCLSLLLHLKSQASDLPKPKLCVLISPWVTIRSTSHVKSDSDYLDPTTLHIYGTQYLGTAAFTNQHLVIGSPGTERDLRTWEQASPDSGFSVWYGKEEVLAKDIKGWSDLVRKGTRFRSHEKEHGIHAWPVAAVYLGATVQQRFEELRKIVLDVEQAFKH